MAAPVAADPVIRLSSSPAAAGASFDFLPADLECGGHAAALGVGSKSGGMAAALQRVFYTLFMPPRRQSKR